LEREDGEKKREGEPSASIVKRTGVGKGVVIFAPDEQEKKGGPYQGMSPLTLNGSRPLEGRRGKKLSEN